MSQRLLPGRRVLTAGRKRAGCIFGVGALCAALMAQHYIPGTKGIGAGTLPASGFQVQDYNLLYYSDTFPTYSSFTHLLTYLNEPRLTWIARQKILGASFGMDLIIPFGYAELGTFPIQRPGFQNRFTQFGLGDVEFSPVQLGYQK